jgi:hypothetical protein
MGEAGSGREYQIELSLCTNVLPLPEHVDGYWGEGCLPAFDLGGPMVPSPSAL